MIPPHWDSNREKPMCRMCGCVEFSEEMVCQGCAEPLVVRPYRREPAIQLIAADKWEMLHWPKDYEKRCFICGWKARKPQESLIPKDPGDLMTAGIWAMAPSATQLGKAICPDKILSERLKLIIGILAHTGENAVFRVTANKNFAAMAAKYGDKKLSFCRQCAEKAAEPVPVEAPTPVTLVDALAAEMKTSGTPAAPDLVDRYAKVGKLVTDRPKITPKFPTISEMKKAEKEGEWGMDDHGWEAGPEEEDWADDLDEPENDEVYEEYEEEEDEDWDGDEDEDDIGVAAKEEDDWDDDQAW